MSLLDGIHHLTFLTNDMDRLVAFYRRVFDATVTLDLREDGLRHAFIAIGADTVLHPFEVRGKAAPGEQPMFDRGRLDHFAMRAASEEAFAELRRRLVAEDATDGMVTDMGMIYLMSFSDPDEGRHELVWHKPGATPADSLPSSKWKSVKMP